MPAIRATAPGKIILFGEHAVVYGRPALAVPVTQVQARAVVMAAPGLATGEVRLEAPDIGLQAALAELPAQHPLVVAIQGVVEELGVKRLPACRIRLTSTIPIASGLGSGAAAAVALIRAVSTFLGRPLPPEKVSALAYEVEKIHHGTPSGIDNTVIAYGQPVYFVRSQPLQRLRVPVPFTLVIGDSGIPSPTAATVADVRQAWQRDPQRYEVLFDAIGAVAQQARQQLEGGQPSELGTLMNENHRLLQELGVSSAELDTLVEAACQAGALGAKLSGGGRGGNMIALVTEQTASAVAQALQAAGARQTLITTVQETAGVDC